MQKEEERRCRRDEIDRQLAFRRNPHKKGAFGNSLNVESCGPPSILDFFGRENGYEARRRLIQKPFKTWCIQELCETRDKENDKKEFESNYSMYIRAEDDIRCVIAIIEKQKMREKNIAMMNENKCLADQRKLETQQMRAVEKELEMKEINNPMFNSAYNTDKIEKPSPYHFKCCSPNIKSSLCNSNANLLEERNLLRKEEMNEENEWACFYRYMDATLVKEETDIEKNQNAEKDAFKFALEQQMQEWHHKKKFLDEERKKSWGEEYFQRYFGTSCR